MYGLVCPEFVIACKPGTHRVVIPDGGCGTQECVPNLTLGPGPVIINPEPTSGSDSSTSDSSETNLSVSDSSEA